MMKNYYRVGALAFLVGIAAVICARASYAAFGALDTADRFPFVVRLESEIGGCSGVVGKSGLLIGTAAHCLWHHGYAQNLVIIYTDADGKERTVRAQSMIVPDRFGPAFDKWENEKDSASSDALEADFVNFSQHDIGFVVPSEPVQTLGTAYWITSLLKENESRDPSCSMWRALTGACGSGADHDIQWTEVLKSDLDTKLKETFGNMEKVSALIVGYGQTGCREMEGPDCVTDHQRRYGEVPLLLAAKAGSDSKIRVPWFWPTGGNDDGINPSRHGDSGGALFLKALDGRWIFAGYNSGGNGRIAYASSLFENIDTFGRALELPEPSSGIYDGVWNLGLVGSRNWAPKQAERFFREVINVWQSPNDQAIRRIKKIYQSEIVGLGPFDELGIRVPITSDKALRAKISLFEKWPTRSYALESPVSAECKPDTRTMICEVTATVKWQLRSEGQLEAGTSVFRQKINLGGTSEAYDDVDQDGPEIMSEREFRSNAPEQHFAHQRSCQVNAPDDLKMRADAGSNKALVLAMPADAFPVYLDLSSCRQAEGSKWCRVEYEGYTGWSNSRYLANCN